MAERRMLILPAEVVEKVNANRSDMSQAEFISFLIDSHLNPQIEERQFVTQEDLQEFQQGIKDLLRNFLEFIVSYGMELGPKPGGNELEALSAKLQGLMSSHGEQAKTKQ